MKDIVKAILILAVIYLLLFFLKTNKTCQVIQDKQSQPVTIVDTLTNVVYDTVYLKRYKTVKLRTTDTTICYITDTVTRVDSVFVEVPISIYKFDTCLTTDSTNLNIRIQNSGFNVTLDSLSYKLEYTPTRTKKIHWFIGPSLGIGYDFTSGKLIPTVGIGIIIKRF